MPSHLPFSSALQASNMIALINIQGCCACILSLSSILGFTHSSVLVLVPLSTNQCNLLGIISQSWMVLNAMIQGVVKNLGVIILHTDYNRPNACQRISDMVREVWLLKNTRGKGAWVKMSCWGAKDVKKGRRQNQKYNPAFPQTTR